MHTLSIVGTKIIILYIISFLSIRQIDEFFNDKLILLWNDWIICFTRDLNIVVWNRLNLF